MWRALWPELPVDEVPIASITNGIHTASWLSREMHELLERYVGPGLRERPEDPAVWERAETIPGGELWRVHELRRERLGDAMRREHRRICVVEDAAIRLTDRRAGDGDDDGFTHGAGPRVRGV